MWTRDGGRGVDQWRSISPRLRNGVQTDLAEGSDTQGLAHPIVGQEESRILTHMLRSGRASGHASGLLVVGHGSKCEPRGADPTYGVNASIRTQHRRVSTTASRGKPPSDRGHVLTRLDGEAKRQKCDAVAQFRWCVQKYFARLKSCK